MICYYFINFFKNACAFVSYTYQRLESMSFFFLVPMKYFINESFRVMMFLNSIDGKLKIYYFSCVGFVDSVLFHVIGILKNSSLRIYIF